MGTSNFYEYRSFKQIVRSTRKKKPTKIKITISIIVYRGKAHYNAASTSTHSYWCSVKVNTLTGELHDHYRGFAVWAEVVSYLFEFLMYGILKSPYEPE